MADDRVRIGKAAQAVGRSASWLREAERIGLIDPPMRDRAGCRWFSRAEIERIRRIVYPRREAPRIESVDEFLRQIESDRDERI